MDSGQGLSLDPGVLSLLKNPGGDNLIATVTQYFPVATHLPHTLIRNSGDGINGIQAAPLECCQFEIFAATNDVAPIDVPRIFSLSLLRTNLRSGCYRSLCRGRSRARADRFTSRGDGWR